MKRFFAVVLALLVLCSFVVTASAKMLIEHGDWMLEKINDEFFEIDEYIGDDSEVTLITGFAAYPVSAVGDSAFAENPYIEVLNTDEALRAIGEYAFIDCVNLSEVNTASGLVYIGVGAFANTYSLIRIDLDVTSVPAIPAYCFANSGVAEVSLPETCASIGNCAFQNCSSLAKIAIPASVAEIADSAFENCDNLVIYTTTGSYAVDYAVAHDIPYVLTDAPQPAQIILGDSDGDGEVTILDATTIQRTLVGLPVARYVEQAADADNDGSVSILDATAIQRYLAYLTTYEGIGKPIDR